MPTCGADGDETTTSELSQRTRTTQRKNDIIGFLLNRSVKRNCPTTIPQTPLWMSNSAAFFTAIGQPLAQPETLHAHLTMNGLETATTANVAPRRPSANGGPRPTILHSRVTALGTSAHLHPGVRSQLTHMPRLNRCVLSHPQRTYRVLHEHMFERRQKKHNETK